MARLSGATVVVGAWLVSAARVAVAVAEMAVQAVQAAMAMVAAVAVAMVAA